MARLGKLATRFLQEQLDELEELSGGDEVDNAAFAKHGVLVYPTYLRVGVEKERTLTMYVKRSLVAKEGDTAVTVTSDSPESLRVIGSPFTLRPHRSKDDRLVGTFKVYGIQPREVVVITAQCPGVPAAGALVQVVELNPEDRVFGEPLEFERPEYRIRHGRNRGIHLFAKYPEIVAHETVVGVDSSNPEKIVIRGRCKLVPVPGTNYAEGVVQVEGRTLNASSDLHVEVNGRRASARVKVVDKPDESGIPIQFDIRDEDFGNFRALWADREGKPNLLLISARHESLRRYLGPPEQKFPGQSTPLFRVLLAEIVAENVCRKALTLESQERPFDFPWADMGKPHLIVDDVFAQVQRRLRDFVAKAHEVMLSDDEIDLTLRSE